MGGLLEEERKWAEKGTEKGAESCPGDKSHGRKREREGEEE